MPHVDVWTRIQAEAAVISQDAQKRQTRPRINPFWGLRYFAPAFIVLIVVGVSLLTYDGLMLRRALQANATPTVVAYLTSSTSRRTYSESAYYRRMAYFEDRLDGPWSSAASPTTSTVYQSDVLDVMYVNTIHKATTNPDDDLRYEMVYEWRKMMEQRTQSASRSSSPTIRPQSIPQNLR